MGYGNPDIAKIVIRRIEEKLKVPKRPDCPKQIYVETIKKN